LSRAHSIGERIRAVRQRAGLSLDRFAEAIGYSRRALINWEQNAAEPPIAVLAKLRRLYDVDPKWVVLGEDITPRSHYGAMDWARFDRIAKDVDAACTQVGIGFEPHVRTELERGLFEDDPADDEGNRKQLRRTLLAIAKGKPA
jgi:transcriptional regulator with XRE-family HTH domain